MTARFTPSPKNQNGRGVEVNDVERDELHSVAVSAVVTDPSGRVLLMRRRDYGNWEPPGGVLKRHEPPQDGVAREIHEETGVGIALGKLSGVYKNVTTGVLTLVFRAEGVSGASKETDEAGAVSWVDPDELDGLLHPEYLRWVQDGLEGSPAVVRTQEATVKGASAFPD